MGKLRCLETDQKRSLHERAVKGDLAGEQDACCCSKISAFGAFCHFWQPRKFFLRTFLRVRTSGNTEMQSCVEVISLAKKLHTHAALSVCRRAVVENFPVMIAGKPFCSRQLWKSAMSFRYRPTPSLPGCVHRIVVRSGWSDRPGRNMLSRSHTRRIPNMLLQKAGDAQHGAPATALCSVRFWPADCRKDCSVVLWQADPCSERVG